MTKGYSRSVAETHVLVSGHIFQKVHYLEVNRENKMFNRRSWYHFLGFVFYGSTLSCLTTIFKAALFDILATWGQSWMQLVSRQFIHTSCSYGATLSFISSCLCPPDESNIHSPYSSVSVLLQPLKGNICLFVNQLLSNCVCLLFRGEQGV